MRAEDECFTLERWNTDCRGFADGVVDDLCVRRRSLPGVPEGFVLADNDHREEGSLPLRRSSKWKSSLGFAIPRRCCQTLAVLSILWGSLPYFSQAEKQEKHFVPPLRVDIPFEAAWEGMLRVLKEEGWTVTRKARAKGEIRTGSREYISGPLTDDHMDKIGQRPRLSGAQWQRVDYHYEVSIQLVSGKETLITLDSNIKALKRSFLGEEGWVAIPSNGRLEKGLLTRFGQFLFGQSFSLTESKKGFWSRFPEIRGGRSPSTDPNRTDPD